MIDLEDQLNFTNKLSHPTNNNKVVYRFFKRDQAEYFTELLVDADIEFEAQEDPDDERKPMYFGVSRALERKVDKLNFTALGRNREKFIASAPLRWIVIGISVLTLILAIVGAVLSE